MGALRLFLALIVAATHLQQHVLAPTGRYIHFGFFLGLNAGYAVMIFFMISGFLMSTVLSSKYDESWNGTLQFYVSRAIRIFSLYWPIAIVSFVVIDGTLRDFREASGPQKLTSFLLLGSDWLIVAGGAENESSWRALLNPLHQGWTLGPELTFYLLAPWLLRSPRAVVLALLASSVTRAALVYEFGFNDTWTYIFSPSTFMFFLLGHAARSALSRYEWLRAPAVGYGLFCTSVVILVLPRESHFDSFRFWAGMLCIAASLPGIFEGTKNNAMLNWLGGLSFPVYLVHNMVLMKFEEWKLVDRLPWQNTFTFTASYFILVVGAAIVAHYVLERPCARIMRAFERAARVRFAGLSAVSAPAPKRIEPVDA